MTLGSVDSDVTQFTQPEKHSSLQAKCQQETQNFVQLKWIFLLNKLIYIYYPSLIKKNVIQIVSDGSASKKSRIEETTVEITHPNQTCTKICHLCKLTFKKHWAVKDVNVLDISM